MQDLKLISVLPPQCSRATRLRYRLCAAACFLTTLSLLKFNRLREAAVSLQEVRVTVCLWLKALTHLNALKSTTLIPPLGALSVKWDHESADQV